MRRRFSDDAKLSTKSLDLDVVIWAFVLATGLEQHNIAAEKRILHFTAENLAEEANILNVDMTCEFCAFRVHLRATSQWTLLMECLNVNNRRRNLFKRFASVQYCVKS